MIVTPRLHPSLQCAAPYTFIQGSVTLFTVLRSDNRASHRLFVMLHQSLFRSPNRMDQHVRSSYSHAQHVGRRDKDVIAVSPHGLSGFQDASNSTVSSGDYRGTDHRSRHRDCEYSRSNQRQALYEPVLDAIGSWVCRYTPRAWSAR